MSEPRVPPASITLRTLAVAAAAFIGAAPASSQTVAPPAPLELLVLGSGGPGALGRASSSYLVSVHGVPRILVDAGSGAFVRLGEAHVDVGSLDIVLLTHLHVDHAAELPGIVKARVIASSAPVHFDIYGPTGHAAHGDVPAFPSTQRWVSLMFGADGAFAYLKDFAAPLSFTVTDLPRPNAPRDRPNVIYQREDLRIGALRGHHDDAPSVIYRIDVGGRSLVFSGDIDAQGLPALETLARGADVLVFHAVVLDPPGSRPVLYTLHTPPQAIGALAGRDHVGRLLLSHLSPEVEANRAAVSASIAAHYTGPVEYASDGLHVTP